MTAEALDLVQLVMDAGPIAKSVLAFLGFFSVISWSIILEKAWQFWKIKSQSRNFMSFFEKSASVQAIYDAAARKSESPLSQVFLSFCRETGCDREDRKLSESGHFIPLRESLLQSGVRGMKRTAGNQIHLMEKHLPFLATTASACPFIGLFGTVWGVMDSFRGIGSQGSANLAVVAPGISEALIATAAGLAAAIPAVMAYNFFVNRVKFWARELESLNMAILNYFQKRP